MSDQLTWRTEQRRIRDLVPWDGNPRKITNEQKEKLAASLGEFGVVEIPVVNTDNRLIAGHQRVAVLIAQGRGEEMIDVRVPDRALTERECQKYNSVSNRHSGEFDWEKLAKMERELLMEIGFTNKEIQKILNAGNEKAEARAKLAERFIVPPFSILDTRSGTWQDRKDAWLKITGNIADTKEQVLWKSASGGAAQYYQQKTKLEQFLGRTITNQEYEEKYLQAAYINEGSSGFDPVLAELIYTWFNPPGGRILDPFGGEQTKGVVAGYLGMDYTAVEFRQAQVDTNNAACSEYGTVRYYRGDSNDIDTIVPDTGYDLVFTSPPYYDLEVYSKEDMSALGTYDEFMAQYKNIFSKCVAKLNQNRFVVVKIGEIRDKKTGVYRNFVGDNIRIMQELGLKYYNEIILINQIGTLPIRAPKQMNQSRKIGKCHQNVLAFYKGEAETLFKETQAVYATHQNVLTFFKGDLGKIEGDYGHVVVDNEVMNQGDV